MDKAKKIANQVEKKVYKGFWWLILIGFIYYVISPKESQLEQTNTDSFISNPTKESQLEQTNTDSFISNPTKEKTAFSYCAKKYKNNTLDLNICYDCLNRKIHIPDPNTVIRELTDDVLKSAFCINELQSFLFPYNKTLMPSDVFMNTTRYKLFMRGD